MRVFLLWKRRCADVRAGTQAPPLRFRLGGLRMDGFVCWLVKTVHMNQHYRCCTFASPGLPTIGGYPGESRRAGTYAIGIVLFKINLRAGNHSFGTVW